MGTEWDARRESRPDVICLEGNGSRESHKGDGWNVGEVMYTLNSTEVHAVCVKVFAVDCRNGTENEINGTLQAKTNGGVSYNCNNVIRIERKDSGSE